MTGMWEWERFSRPRFDAGAEPFRKAQETRRRWWAQDMLRGSTAEALMRGRVASSDLIVKALEDLVTEKGAMPVNLRGI